MAMNLKPLGDRVVVEPSEQEEKTASGIILPETAKEKPQEGKVIAAGPGLLDGGVRQPMDVKVGDRVLFAKYAGSEIKLDNNRRVIVMRQTDLLAIIE